jgi:hypothetical protein
LIVSGDPVLLAGEESRAQPARFTASMRRKGAGAGAMQSGDEEDFHLRKILCIKPIKRIDLVYRTIPILPLIVSCPYRVAKIK